MTEKQVVIGIIAVGALALLLKSKGILADYTDPNYMVGDTEVQESRDSTDDNGGTL
jgi:hypothetical protein